MEVVRAAGAEGDRRWRDRPAPGFALLLKAEQALEVAASSVIVDELAGGRERARPVER